ncbi:unnamed protein product, partial [Allacma fusca]
AKHSFTRACPLSWLKSLSFTTIKTSNSSNRPIYQGPAQHP